MIYVITAYFIINLILFLIAEDYMIKCIKDKEISSRYSEQTTLHLATFVMLVFGLPLYIINVIKYLRDSKQ